MAPNRCSRSACDSFVDSSQTYCEPHRCTADVCRNARSDNSRFCSDHLKCVKSGCTAPRHYPDSNEQFPPFCFCADHWWYCRDPECATSVYPALDTYYCETHRCQFPRCRSSASTGRQSCPIHACTFALCVELVQSDLRACKAHACQEPGCPYPVYPGRTACRAHVCRISATTCNGMGADYHEGQHYCMTHTCIMLGCLQSTLDVRSTPEQTFTKCSQHRCVAQHCPHSRRLNSDHCRNHDPWVEPEWETVEKVAAESCDGHMNSCIHPSCPNARSDYGHWNRSQPRLLHSWDRYWVREGFREHFSSHECVAADCINTQEYSQGRKYCQDHDEVRTMLDDSGSCLSVITKTSEVLSSRRVSNFFTHSTHQASTASITSV
jgi:hypothetical protein